jgi:hypothetical protein
MKEDLKEIITGCLETYAQLLINNSDENGNVNEIQIKSILVTYTDLVIDSIEKLK